MLSQSLLNQNQLQYNDQANQSARLLSDVLVHNLNNVLSNHVSQIFNPATFPAPQQQARVIRPRPQPVVPQRAAPQQPRFQPQQAVPQQPRFQPQQRFTPAAPQQTSGPLPSSVSFFNHPYIQDFDSGAGVFSYSYGK